MNDQYPNVAQVRAEARTLGTTRQTAMDAANRWMRESESVVICATIQKHGHEPDGRLLPNWVSAKRWLMKSWPHFHPMGIMRGDHMVSTMRGHRRSTRADDVFNAICLYAQENNGVTPTTRQARRWASRNSITSIGTDSSIDAAFAVED